MSMTRLPDFKIGTTFDRTFVRVDDDGSPVDITDTLIRSSIRVPGGEEIPLLVFKVNPILGEYSVRASAIETSTWPLGMLQFDILYIDDDVVTSAPEDKNIIIKTFRGATEYAYPV